MASDTSCRNTGVPVGGLEDPFSCPPNKYYTTGFLGLQRLLDAALMQVGLAYSFLGLQLLLNAALLQVGLANVFLGLQRLLDAALLRAGLANTFLGLLRLLDAALLHVRLALLLTLSWDCNTYFSQRYWNGC